MIQAGLIACTFAIICWLIGKFFFNLIKVHNTLIESKVLCGLLILMIYSANLIELNFQPNPIVLVGVLFGLQLRLIRVSNRNLGNFRCNFTKQKVLNFGLSMLIVVIASSFNNSKPFESTLALRNGPDLIGYSTAAQYICGENTVKDLKKEVLKELNAKNFALTQTLPASENPYHLYRLNSWTEQLNSEFLISAHRTGIIGSIGGMCGLFNGQNSIPFVSGFITFLFAFSFFLFFNFFTRGGLRNTPAFFFGFIGTFNVNLLFASLEGGAAQLSTIPFWVYFFYEFLRKNPKFENLTRSFFACVLISLATYTDFLFALIPVFFTLSFYILRVLSVPIKSFIRILTFYSLITLAVSLPIVFQVSSLIMSRFKGHPGGWDTGRPLSLSEAFGLFNFFPADGVNVSNFSSLTIVVSCMTSIYIIFIVYRSHEFRIKLMFFSIFIIFLLQTINVYFLNDKINNYSLVKYSAYIACLLPFLIYFSTSGDSPKKLHKRYSINPLLLRNVTVILCLSSISTWSSDWFQNRTLTFDREQSKALQPLLREHEFVASGFKGSSLARFNLIENFRFMGSRGFEIYPNYSSPALEMLYLVPIKICPKLTCNVKVNNLEIQMASIYQDWEIAVLKPKKILDKP